VLPVVASLTAVLSAGDEIRWNRYLPLGMHNMSALSLGKSLIVGLHAAALVFLALLLLNVAIFLLKSCLLRFRLRAVPVRFSSGTAAERISLAVALLAGIGVYAAVRTWTSHLPLNLIWTGDTATLTWRNLTVASVAVPLFGLFLLARTTRWWQSLAASALGRISRRVCLLASLAGLLLVAAGLVFSRQPPPVPGGTNVLLIVLDTLRQSNLSLYGHHRPTTPRLEEFAAEAEVFDNAFAVAPWTPPNHASIFTGLFPRQHRSTAESKVLPRGAVTLAEIFSDGGYETAAFVNNPQLASGLGFDQGFRRYYDLWRKRVRHSFLPDGGDSAKDDGAVVTGEAVRTWIRERGDERPFFAFINYMEAHSPYFPPEPYRWEYLDGPRDLPERSVNYNYLDFLSGEYTMSEEDFAVARALYDGEVRYLDEQVGSLLADLRNDGILENTLVIITSDHGEQFGEHELVGHMFSLYDSLLRVPLVVRDPRGSGGGERRAEPVMLLDIFATVLRAAGLKSPAPLAIQGQDLLAAVPARPVIAESGRPVGFLGLAAKKDPPFDASPVDRRMRSVREGGYKLIWSSDGRDELYLTAADPRESKNLLAASPEKAARLENVLRAWEEAVPEGTIRLEEGAAPTGNNEHLERLKALGYVQ